MYSWLSARLWFLQCISNVTDHDDVIKWKHFPRNWPFVRGIHRSPVKSPHKGQWCGALMFSLICVWINDWVNNHEAGDLRRYCAHSDVIVMCTVSPRKCENVLFWFIFFRMIYQWFWVNKCGWLFIFCMGISLYTAYTVECRYNAIQYSYILH